MINDKKKEKIFDIQERTAQFGEDIIEFVKKIPKNIITNTLISQLIRSGTSVGANCCEADCAESSKDFQHKLNIAKKEAKEAKHWLRMIAKAVPEFTPEARLLWKEANEIQLILISIVKNTKENKK